MAKAANVAQTRDNYRDAGVDTDAADEGLARLTRRIAATWPPAGALGAVKLPIGYFANVVEVHGHGIAISTDGVGSKTMIAAMLGKYDTVGIDCVAMNVNDVVCVGATPVSLVDYIAADKVDAAMLDAIAVGLCEGAKRAGVSISGGETAQLPDMVAGFDLAGTAIGHVPGTLLTTVFGDQLEGALTGAGRIDWWIVGGLAAAVGAGILAVRRWFNRMARRIAADAAGRQPR